MAAIPQSPKPQHFCRREMERLPDGSHFGRATNRPIGGIIDCAFENSENDLASGTALPNSLSEIA
jgi:hypothetical protein